eukprot:CAMPEP_0177415056 /NCGR_PEP_ID=MMETSP0368-20130122/67377_1 /TAXON_ID=447022 ORGANISM="Scrippsiella hangoei-like, Strain SHHI-4" /NCGR_SAMPLE_ID=MMETSP0368 /ASSEMBLY_ACC=CAM_ASM_000363 /LENGTH=164 /DNA_ID=CAMNT_0018884473 /DNA_START=186 /DNA_END=680 /DNA_ORIENTATION=+
MAPAARGRPWNVVLGHDRGHEAPRGGSVCLAVSIPILPRGGISAPRRVKIGGHHRTIARVLPAASQLRVAEVLKSRQQWRVMLASVAQRFAHEVVGATNRASQIARRASCSVRLHTKSARKLSPAVVDAGLREECAALPLAEVEGAGGGIVRLVPARVLQHRQS